MAIMMASSHTRNAQGNDNPAPWSQYRQRSVETAPGAAASPFGYPSSNSFYFGQSNPQPAVGDSPRADSSFPIARRRSSAWSQESSLQPCWNIWGSPTTQQSFAPSPPFHAPAYTTPIGVPPSKAPGSSLWFGSPPTSKPTAVPTMVSPPLSPQTSADALPGSPPQMFDMESAPS